MKNSQTASSNHWLETPTSVLKLIPVGLLGLHRKELCNRLRSWGKRKSNPLHETNAPAQPQQKRLRAMRQEIAAATSFIVETFLQKHATPRERERFAHQLTTLLAARYNTHWHPHCPWQGNAYRALCWEGEDKRQRDHSLCAAAKSCGLNLENVLPDLTVWVDPEEVSAKIGQHGSVFKVAMT